MDTSRESLNDIVELIDNLKESGCVHQYLDDVEFNGRKVVINGNDLIFFGSCSYLGLERHPELINGAIASVKKYSSQISCSRALISCSLYKNLEDNLKEIFKGYPIITPTTTLGHCSAMPVLIEEHDAIILDSYVHNSVRMAADLCRSKGTFVLQSIHNDMNNLEYFYYRLKKKGHKKIWYCADGVYSMHGNFIDIHNLSKLLDKYEDLYAYIDDAHSVSWYGVNGCGYVLDSIGLNQKVILAISFAKSFAANGGMILLPNEKLAKYVRSAGQTLIFSGPIPPSVLGALDASVQLHLSPEITKKQTELKSLIEYFRDQCQKNTIPLSTKDITPIQMIKIGNKEVTYNILNELIKRNCFVTAVTYPAVNQGSEGIRITITRHITKQDIDYLINQLILILKKA